MWPWDPHWVQVLAPPALVCDITQVATALLRVSPSGTQGQGQPLPQWGLVKTEFLIFFLPSIFVSPNIFEPPALCPVPGTQW